MTYSNVSLYQAIYVQDSNVIPSEVMQQEQKVVQCNSHVKNKQTQNFFAILMGLSPVPINVLLRQI